MNRARVIILSLAIIAAAAAQAQQNIQNAKLETRSATAGLQSQVDAIVHQGAAAWIAWSLPSIRPESEMCCYNMNGGDVYGCGCALESGGVSKSGSGAQAGAVKLEGAATFRVFLRSDGHEIQKVGAFGDNCPIDAQNMPVYWLTDVRPEQSAAVLSALAQKSGSDGEKRSADGAILAIAMTNDASADRALDELIDARQPEWLRKKVAFWMGNQRGKAGLTKLLALMKSDPSDSFRRELVFPISQSREPEAETELIRIAKQDQSTRVREQAIFWLAQKAGRKAAAFLKDTVDNDPDTEVKKRAVFALSQMPKDEGIPLLIQVARNNPNPAVKKQAIFWLGQSHDSRALDYIESVLKQ